MTDFGIARPIEARRGRDPDRHRPRHLATTSRPSRRRASRVDERTDVYSLGVVLYELLTGEVPFTGDNFVAIAMQHINEPPPPREPRRGPRCRRGSRPRSRRRSRRTRPARFATMDDFRGRARGVPRRGSRRRPPSRPRDDGSVTVVLPPARREEPRRRGGRAAAAADRARARAPRRRRVARRRDAGSALGDGGGSDGGGGRPAAAGRSRSRASAPGTRDGAADGRARRRRADATDGNQATYWPTENYRELHASRASALVLDAGETVTLTALTVTSDTPGLHARIQAGDRPHGAVPRRLGRQRSSANARSTSTARTARYFVVWITNLPPGGSAHVNEVTAS